MNKQDAVTEVLKENFERLGTSLENLRSMLQDLVLGVPSLPDAERIAKAVIAALPEAEAPAPPPEAPPEEASASQAPAVLNNKLLFHMAEIEYAASQAEVLNKLLAGVEEYAQRGVLFVVRNDLAQAWNSFGFDNNEEAKRWSASMTEEALLKSVAGSRTRLMMDDTVPPFIPVEGPVKRSVITPLLLKGKVMAFLYADSGEDGVLDHYSIDILMRTASLVIDIFPLRIKRQPLPPSLENQGIISSVSKAPEAEEEEEAALFEDTGTLAAQSESEELPSAQTVIAEIPPELAAQPAEEASEQEPVELDSGEYEEVSEEEAQALPEEEPQAEEAEAAEEEPIPPGEEKAHQDAERFARLLVQEISLYHPKEVEKGKASGNLYALLKDDIERSREAYENRFKSPSIKGKDYFNKALLAYLADGDPALLGS